MKKRQIRNLFKMPKAQALLTLDKLTKTGKLKPYIKKYHPEYLLLDGTVATFTLAKDLGVI